ncbi:hypothetical protein [Burkholderia pseudomallei]|uniref:hypothetical protein n=1 Tax=Burkholderia pseudomallei TaxID=28450 RepID=UPI0005728B99|nr:hypothetical protein [Burkholderia pseudomallei]
MRDADETPVSRGKRKRRRAGFVPSFGMRACARDAAANHAYAEWNTDSVRTKSRTIHEPPSPDKYIVVLSKSQDLDSIPPIGPRMAARRFVVGIVDSAMGRK